MRNQILQWSMLIVPWLTLFFMKKEDIKRFFPVAVLSALTSVIIHHVGNSLQWWEQIDLNYPFVIPFYLLGLHPVITMWIFKFTYRKFWLYVVVEAVMNMGFNTLFLGWFLIKMGMRQIGNMSPFVAFFITMAHGLVLYVYQIWQEGIFVSPYQGFKIGKKDKQPHR